MHLVTRSGPDDQNALVSTPQQIAPVAGRSSIGDILSRYPAISEDELAAVLHFLAKGKHLDVGMIAGSDEFRETVIDLQRRHRAYFRPKPVETIIFLLATAGPVAALFWRYLL